MISHQRIYSNTVTVRRTWVYNFEPLDFFFRLVLQVVLWPRPGPAIRSELSN